MAVTAANPGLRRQVRRAYRMFCENSAIIQKLWGGQSWPQPPFQAARAG
jgi:hypothetical protein